MQRGNTWLEEEHLFMESYENCEEVRLRWLTKTKVEKFREMEFFSECHKDQPYVSLTSKVMSNNVLLASRVLDLEVDPDSVCWCVRIKSRYRQPPASALLNQVHNIP